MRRVAAALSVLACAGLMACSGGSSGGGSQWGQSPTDLAKKYHVCAEPVVTGGTAACTSAGVTISLTVSDDDDEQSLFVAMVKDNNPDRCMIVAPGFVITSDSPLAMQTAMGVEPKEFATKHKGHLDGFCYSS